MSLESKLLPTLVQRGLTVLTSLTEAIVVHAIASAVSMMLEPWDEQLAQDLFCRLDQRGQGYLGPGKVLRVLCSGIFAECQQLTL
eukprot:s4430_g5.t4